MHMQGRRLFVIILCSFILASVGTTIFAWTVVGGVRDNARVASARLRLVTNTITAYTETFGAFPFSAIELSASQSESARAELDIALQSVQVEWSIDRFVQPILRTDGKPTQLESLPNAAADLARAAEALRKPAATPAL